MTTAARELPTLAPSAELAAAWADWSDWRHATSDADVAAMVALLMAAPIRTELDGLILDSGGWTREQAATVDAAHERGTPEWVAALDATPYAHVTLTADGRYANRQAWCTCANDDVAADGWVRYEFWSTESGKADRRHGFVHDTCRKILQTG